MAETTLQASTNGLMQGSLPRTLPKKLTELGRIRIGDREANKTGRGTHPHKLDVFRLTSPNSPLLHYAANAYGGEVRPWMSDGAPKDEHGRPQQWELYTTVNTIEVLIPTTSAVSLSFEQWSASGCQRRCTGEVITHCPLQEALINTACTCPADELTRADQAKTGHACARILRLNVLLPDLPGMGVWRLETKGFYATAELLGTLEILQMAGQEQQIIEAALRLEQRSVKRPGTGEGKGTLKFAVPVLWPKWTPRQLLSKAAAQGLLLMDQAASMPLLPSLATEISALCGDGGGADPTAFPPRATPLIRTPDACASGEDALSYVAQIEAAIVAQKGGQIEPWYVWAERKYQKLRGAFTVSDWEDFLDAVRTAARLRGTVVEEPPPPAAPVADPAAPFVDPETGEVVTPDASAGPSWGPESPNLFLAEEEKRDA